MTAVVALLQGEQRIGIRAGVHAPSRIDHGALRFAYARIRRPAWACACARNPEGGIRKRRSRRSDQRCEVRAVVLETGLAGVRFSLMPEEVRCGVAGRSELAQ